MLKKTVLCSVALATALVVPSLVGRAQGVSTAQLPADAKVISRIDVEALQKSEFGKRLIELTLDRALETLADQIGIPVPDVEDVQNFLGFDAIAETKNITIVATDFETPESGLLVVAELKKTTGNLEGILSAHVPGYSVKKVGDYDVHTGSPDGNKQIHLAIRTGADGAKTLVVGGSEELLTKHLERLDGKGTSGYAYTPVAGALLEVLAQDIPAEKLGDGPQTFIFSMANKVSVDLKEIDNALKLAIGFTASNDENAEQLDQIFQGFVPMIEGAAPDFSGIEVKREGAKVILLASIASDRATELLGEQFDSVLGTVQGMVGGR